MVVVFKVRTPGSCSLCQSRQGLPNEIHDFGARVRHASTVKASALLVFNLSQEIRGCGGNMCQLLHINRSGEMIHVRYVQCIFHLVVHTSQDFQKVLHICRQECIHANEIRMTITMALIRKRKYSIFPLCAVLLQD